MKDACLCVTQALFRFLEKCPRRSVSVYLSYTDTYSLVYISLEMHEKAAHNSRY